MIPGCCAANRSTIAGSADDATEFRAPDTKFPDGRISQTLDIPDSLLQFIERHETAPKHGVRINGRLDSFRAAVEQAHAKRVFKVGNHLGHGRLRDTKLSRCLRHAAALHDNGKHVKVAEPEASTNLAFPIDLWSHRFFTI